MCLSVELLAAQTASVHRRKVAAWNKASFVVGWPSDYRMDAFGNVMRWGDYGDRSSAYGWEIDHIVPVALGGGDGPENLRALHWRNNASLGGILGARLGG